MRLFGWMAATLCLGLLTQTTSAQTPIGERLREAFERLDGNADGILERSEIPDEGLPAFDRLLKRGDTNSDGKLDVPELQALGEKVRGLTRAAGAGGERLQAMDANQDGKITREEFRGPAALFDRLDTNKDGVLTDAERRPAGRANARPGAAGAGGERLRAMDANQDGKITREEFRGPAALFDRLDTNKDGVLTDAERRPAGRANARPGAAGAGGERLRAMDANQDGKITREEFRGPAALFDRLDTNGDGVLDRSDRSPAGARPRPGRPNQRQATPDA